jgi:hypothetical protein
MVVSNFSTPFYLQGNNFFQSKSLPGQMGLQGSQSGSDLLTRLADNLTQAQEGARSRFDTLKLEFSGLEASDDSTLEEMPDELLELFLNQFQVSATTSAREESELVEFRDQLTAFDETIAQYQAMLDGEAALPEGMEQDTVQGLLDAAKSARETFLQKGVEQLNKYTSRDTVSEDSYTSKSLDRVLGTDWRDGLDDSSWTIDANADDIYGEIDRVLSKTHSVTQTLNSGISKVVTELERRGHALSDPYQDYFDHQKAVATHSDTQRASAFQELYDSIWMDFRKVVSSGTQAATITAEDLKNVIN